MEQINKFTFDIYCIRFDFADSMKARSIDIADVKADFCAGIEPTKVNENSSAYLLSDSLSFDDIPSSIASSIIAASVRGYLLSMICFARLQRHIIDFNLIVERIQTLRLMIPKSVYAYIIYCM